MHLKEYLKMIYIYYIQKKSFKYVDSIVIYLENSKSSTVQKKKKVYKVLLRYDDKHKKALRKLKINSLFKFVSDPKEEIIEDELIKNDNHERLTIIYNKKKDISNVVIGEDYKMTF